MIEVDPEILTRGFMIVFAIGVALGFAVGRAVTLHAWLKDTINRRCSA